MSERRRIPLSEPVLDGNEQAYVAECFASNFVSSVGPFIERFEREFAAYVGARFAVACASGTAALHVAMRLLGVGPGDEVFVPTLTFIASANPIAYERATPVFVDAEERTWNIDPALVVEEIERRVRAGLRLPRAVEVVHILGHPADIDPIVTICERHGIAVIEDAAEALGARWSAGAGAGRHVGTLGRVGCFSFNGNKIVTTGGGGMIVTDDESLARRAKHLTTQARLPGAEYRHDEVGYNYRLTNMAAALGVAQLEQLPRFVAAKRAIARRYDEAFGDRPELSLPPRVGWADPTYWLYSVRARTRRNRILAALAERAIEARPIWSPLHTQPMYATAPRLGGTVAERIFAEGVSLPCTPNLPERDQRVVIDEVLRQVAD